MSLMMASSESPLVRMVSMYSRCSSLTGVIEQEARHADDAVHGRANLVRHVRQKLALERGAAQGVVAGFGEFGLDLFAFRDLLVEDAVGLGELRGAVLDARFEVFLGAADDLFCPLALGDVGARADPFAHAPVPFEHGHAARREVPVAAVGHAHTVFVLVDGLGFQRPAPEVGGALAVVGVDDGHPAVVRHLLEGLAGGGAPFGEVLRHAALGVGQPDDLRAGGDQRTVALLTAQGRLAGAFLVVDVRAGAEPLDDMLPWASTIGMARLKCQRYAPSWPRRMRISESGGLPVSMASRMRSAERFWSSGWMAASQPPLRASSTVMPVYSWKRRLK